VQCEGVPGKPTLAPVIRGPRGLRRCRASARPSEGHACSASCKSIRVTSVSTSSGELVPAPCSGERCHSEPGGHPFPRIVASHGVPGVSNSRGLVSHRVSLIPLSQPNRRVSYRRAHPRSAGRFLAFPSTTPALLAGCSTESSVPQQPLRVPLFVSTTLTNLVPMWLKRSGGTGRCALESSRNPSRSSTSVPAPKAR
jgi:hypothetical protein